MTYLLKLKCLLVTLHIFQLKYSCYAENWGTKKKKASYNIQNTPLEKMSVPLGRMQSDQKKHVCVGVRSKYVSYVEMFLLFMVQGK